jgi:predicted metal-dependent enzyme (double-stranded beta helix superfamily)
MASSYGDVEEFRFDPAEFADELAHAAENFAVGTRLLHEDDRIRVWDLTLAPGERLPFHRHRTTYFYRCHAGGPTRVRFPGGTGAVYDSVVDEVHLHEIGPDDVVVHSLENVGDSPLVFTTVELLGG